MTPLYNELISVFGSDAVTAITIPMLHTADVSEFIRKLDESCDNIKNCKVKYN